MGATYTRQSTFTDGDIITAAHSNDEFNQLLAAFAASTGHTHDGTTAEGGPITKLLGNALTFGTGADTDIAITFDGNSSDGVLTWKEDEDYFEFSDDILIASTEKLQFRDTAIHISSSTDGQLDLVADGAVVVDTAGDITLDADGGDIFFKDGGTTFGSATNTSGNLIIKSGTTTAMTFDGANVTFAGTITIGSAGISETELEVLDGATVTTDELNILDGDTSATSTTVADADRVVFNDAGTMKQVAVTDLAAYFDDEITAMPNLTSVGTLTTLTVDNVIINGTTIGHTDDTDLITVADGIVTVAGEISVTTLDIGGTNVTSTATELNLLDGVSGLVQADFTKLAAVDSTAAELNIVDGDTSATSTTLADADRVVVNDNGTMVQVALTDFETYFESALDTLSNVTTVGALNSGSITSGFGAINNGSSAITTTGTITYGSLSDGSITITAFVDEDDMSSNSATLVPTQQSVKAYVDTQITAEDLDFQADSGGALSIDLDSETLTFTGGTGIDTSGSGNAVTFAIDSTVATLTGTQTLTNKTLTTPIANAGIQLKNGATSAGFLEFFEDSDNGTNKVTLIGPASTADVTLTLPSATDTLVGKATTDTLTNKSIDSDNNTITNIVNADIKSSAAIADTKLDTISTANKVSLTALDIDGASDIGEAIADADLFIIDNGAGGTNRKVAASALKTYAGGSSATKGFATAMAIAL